MTVAGQRAGVAAACAALAPVAEAHELVISHGSGPQAELLSLPAAPYDAGSDGPTDVPSAQTEGMIGYLIEQELGNLLPSDAPLVTVLTMTEVDPDDGAFASPSLAVGPVYAAGPAHRMAEQRGWVFRQEGRSWRRVVPSPQPRRILEIRPVDWLLAHGCVVICAGGGGMPIVNPRGTHAPVGVGGGVGPGWGGARLPPGLGGGPPLLPPRGDAGFPGWRG